MAKGNTNNSADARESVVYVYRINRCKGARSNKSSSGPGVFICINDVGGGFVDSILSDKFVGFPRNTI